MRRFTAVLACTGALVMVCLAPASASAVRLDAEDILQLDDGAPSSVEVPHLAPVSAVRIDIEDVYQFDDAPARPHVVLQMHYHF